ncbi:MAG: LysR family transcriptional regulator [Oscillospiraceae bacterium]|nr:LysR family transcriptional regulator [Oscillospiraceae bacterium]
MVTLQQLRYFRELAATGHLTQTAERLYITQTTLSNTIINLEKQLGVKLFDRVGRTLQLNNAGRLYLMYVNEALIALDNGQNALSDFKEEYQQSVSVAMPVSSVWSNLIQGFHTRYHHYSLRQITCEKNQFRPLLTDQQIDFVIAGVDDMPLSGLEHYIIRVEELFACVPLNHPLAGKDGIYLAEVKDEPFINLPANNSFRVFCDELFKKAGIQYRAELECDYSLRGKLVAAGFGIAITTNSSRQQNTLGEDVAYIPIKDDFAKRPIAIIWNPRHYLSKAALDFRDYVMETEL